MFIYLFTLTALIAVSRAGTFKSKYPRQGFKNLIAQGPEVQMSYRKCTEIVIQLRNANFFSDGNEIQ